ncbi:hypothetical protein BH10PSE9_BH10PSE9_06720 [soil metagenome]
MKKTVLFLLWILAMVSWPATAAEFQAKMSVLDLGVLETGRPSKINIWYPQGDCAESAASLCLAEGAVTRKVLVFSPGSMGSAEEYSWLGNSLAAAGFILVGINHYGESRIYGQGTQDPRSTAFIWQRTQDISALLTKLAGEKVFQRAIDWTNVIAIGHSEGGQTVSLLAGARYDLRQLAAYCESEAGKADLSCNYSRNAGRAPDSFVALFNASYQDTRVKKIVLLDPALGSGLQRESLRAIALPSLFVGATHNDFLPWESHGARYASGIPNVQTILLEGQEGHFIFLTPCQHPVAVMGVRLCEDRPGVDRAAVQQALAPQIVDFVRQDNEPASVARHEGAAPQGSAGYIHSGGFFEILLYTPRWVFALLAGLLVFGLMQVRTRRVAVWVALLLPVGMQLLSLSGILLYVGVWLPALAAWLLGLSAVAVLYLKTVNPDAAKYDAGSGRLIIAGSWIPMLVILGIFAVRYALGVANGMELAISQDPKVQLAVSLLLGGFSGFFLGRGLLFWRAQTPRHAM